tara:strand:+ start:313 stop:744 length:432 start_codon:yes stop_codon:yes gene_type:complete
MNSYERIYNILTESTPAGREGSKDVGRKFGAQIALAKPGPYGTPSRMGLKGKHAEDLTATLTKQAKEKGEVAIKTDPVTIAAREDARKKDIMSRHPSKYARAQRGTGPNPTSRKRGADGNLLTPGGKRIYRTEAGVKTYRRNP